jgi:hypothetical protein
MTAFTEALARPAWFWREALGESTALAVYDEMRS